MVSHSRLHRESMKISRRAGWTGELLRRHVMVSVGALTLVLLVMQDSGAFGSAVEDDDYTRSTLRGLHGVYVAVEPLSPDIESQGLTAAALKSDSELQLRMAGIRVLSKKEWATTKGGPVCYVEVNVVSDMALAQDLGFDLFAYEIKVEFNQDVVLVRDVTFKALSPTWSTSYLGITNSLPRVRGKVKDLVAAFVAAYLDVNPKEADKGPLDFPGED